MEIACKKKREEEGRREGRVLGLQRVPITCPKRPR
jgi:hypothetical protein